MLKYQHGGDATDKTDAAADGEINLTGEQNHEHAEREGADDGELDDELGEIAGAKKRGFLHREEHGNREEGEGEGEELRAGADGHAAGRGGEGMTND